MGNPSLPQFPCRGKNRTAPIIDFPAKIALSCLGHFYRYLRAPVSAPSQERYKGNEIRPPLRKRNPIHVFASFPIRESPILQSSDFVCCHIAACPKIENRRLDVILAAPEQERDQQHARKLFARMPARYPTRGIRIGDTDGQNGFGEGGSPAKIPTKSPINPLVAIPGWRPSASIKGRIISSARSIIYWRSAQSSTPKPPGVAAVAPHQTSSAIRCPGKLQCTGRVRGVRFLDIVGHIPSSLSNDSRKLSMPHYPVEI